MANTQQAEEWNGDTGRFWTAHEERYDAMLAPPTVHLVAAAAIQPSHRVLDIGCGCGVTTRIAARRATAGSVLGIDISAPMLERARDRARREGLRNVRYELADAQLHDFPAGEFDVAQSRFGIMFFDDPGAAFTNVRRALRPGGRLVFLCWQALDRNEHRTVALGAIAAYVPLPPPPPPDGPGAFSLADRERVGNLLTVAGFADVRIEPVHEPLPLGADAADATAFLRHITPIRVALAGVDDATAGKAVDALCAALSPYQTPAGVVLNSAAWLVTARA